jgi:uncharacterized protein GlcG (DUF336 family)
MWRVPVLLSIMFVGWSPLLAEPASVGMTTLQAIRMIERVRAFAKAHELRLGIAVVDAEGHLVAAVRMDDAPYQVTDRALACARNAVLPPSDASALHGAGIVMFEGRLLGALAASAAGDLQVDDAIDDGVKAIGTSGKP